MAFGAVDEQLHRVAAADAELASIATATARTAVPRSVRSRNHHRAASTTGTAAMAIR